MRLVSFAGRRLAVDFICCGVCPGNLSQSSLLNRCCLALLGLDCLLLFAPDRFDTVGLSLALLAFSLLSSQLQLQRLVSCSRLGITDFLVCVTLSLGGLINQRLFTPCCCITLRLCSFCGFALRLLYCGAGNGCIALLLLALGLLGVELGDLCQLGFVLGAIGQQDPQGGQRLVLNLGSLPPAESSG